MQMYGEDLPGQGRGRAQMVQPQAVSRCGVARSLRYSAAHAVGPGILAGYECCQRLHVCQVDCWLYSTAVCMAAGDYLQAKRVDGWQGLGLDCVCLLLLARNTAVTACRKRSRLTTGPSL